MTQVVPNACATSVFHLPALCEHVPKLLRGCVPPTPELSEQDAIVEGRKVTCTLHPTPHTLSAGCEFWLSCLASSQGTGELG